MAVLEWMFAMGIIDAREYIRLVNATTPFTE